MRVECRDNGILFFRLCRYIRHVLNAHLFVKVLSVNDEVVQFLGVVGVVGLGEHQVHEVPDVVECAACAVVADLHNIAAAICQAVNIVACRRVADTEADVSGSTVVERHLHLCRRICKAVFFKVLRIFLNHG